MFWNHLNAEADRKTNVADPHSILAIWEVAVTREGFMVRPIGSELSPRDIALLARRLTACDSSLTADRVVMDFSNVNHFGPQWTVVLAMLLDLSRRLNGAVTVSGLHGQPAAVASLYGRNRSLRRLLAA